VSEGILFRIGTDGIPKNIPTTSKLKFGLHERVVEALQKWRFKPAMRSGKPIEVNAMFFVTFVM
jgi:hypothetical protein